MEIDYMRPVSKAALLRYRYVYLLIAPALIFLFVYRYLPMYGLLIAFKRFQPLEGILGSPWVGFDVFGRMFNTPTFLRVFRNTIVISFGKLIFNFPLPIIFALLLNEMRNLRIKKVVQTISYLPHFLSWVVIAGVIIEFLSLGGPVNTILSILGRDKILFMTKETAFLPIVFLSTAWQGMGWGSIIYLSAISGIDPQLYEAAEIDGAGRFARIRHITLPSLVPVIFLLFLLRLGYMMNAGFDQIFNLYNPTVYSVGDIIDTYAYRIGLVQADYSFATAVGLFKNIVGVALMLSVNYFSRKQREYGVV